MGTALQGPPDPGETGAAAPMELPAEACTPVLGPPAGSRPSARRAKSLWLHQRHRGAWLSLAHSRRGSAGRWAIRLQKSQVRCCLLGPLLRATLFGGVPGKRGLYPWLHRPHWLSPQRGDSAVSRQGPAVLVEWAWPWRASGGCPRPARRGLGHALSCPFSPDSLRAPGDDRQAPPWGGDIVRSHNSHLGVPGGSLVGSPRVSGPKVRAAGEAGEGGEFSLKTFFCYFPLTTDTQHSLGCGCPAQ